MQVTMYEYRYLDLTQTDNITKLLKHFGFENQLKYRQATDV